MVFEVFKPKITGKKYRFNDFPFNTMNWLNGNSIEAIFNIGNPKKGDVIEYRSKKFGLQEFVISHIESQGSQYLLIVNHL